MKPMHFPLRVIQNRIGWVPQPSWVTYLVCNRCNAQCSMCDSWKLPRGKELSPDEVERVFRKLGSLDIVRLSGGEPFLRTDLLDVAHAVMRASSPAVLHVTTNGSYSERVLEFAKRFERPRRLRLMVSVDGMPETHDANRGRVVTFEQVVETVRRLVALRKRGVQVSVNHTVISAQSLRDAPRIREYFARLEVDVHWVLAYEDSAMYGATRRGSCADDLIQGRGYPLHPEIDLEEARRFVRFELGRLDCLKDHATRWAKRYYVHGLMERLDGQNLPKPKPKCVALRSHLRLLPNADVVVCQFNTRIVGNLLDEELESVWHADATMSSRSWVDRCPGCWAECEVLPNAVYSGDLLIFRAASGME